VHYVLHKNYICTRSATNSNRKAVELSGATCRINNNFYEGGSSNDDQCAPSVSVIFL